MIDERIHLDSTVVFRRGQVRQCVKRMSTMHPCFSPGKQPGRIVACSYQALGGPFPGLTPQKVLTDDG